MGGGANPPPTWFQVRLNSDRGTAAPRPGGRHYAASAPLATTPPLTTVNAHRPLSAAHAELYDLHSLAAVIDAHAPRAESAIWPL